jgi:hypothetical protein
MEAERMARAGEAGEAAEGLGGLYMLEQSGEMAGAAEAPEGFKARD